MQPCASYVPQPAHPSVKVHLGRGQAHFFEGVEAHAYLSVWPPHNAHAHLSAWPPLNTYTHTHLPSPHRTLRLFGPGLFLQHLSCLLLDDGGKYLERMAVTSSTGEECILTWRLGQPRPRGGGGSGSGSRSSSFDAFSGYDSMDVDSSLVLNLSPFADPMSSSGSSRAGGSSSGGSSSSTPWKLISVTGETAHQWAEPLGPSPELSPELVVEIQLQALR